MEKIRFYTLAVKYWLQGDEWEEAKAYAAVITGRWVR